MLSIAENELSRNSRVEELIALNKQTYPQLSQQSPFIEIGWELLLPPKFVRSSSGYLVIYSGEIMAQNDSSLVLNFRAGIRGTEDGVMMYKEPHTRHFGKDSFVIGNCIFALVDTSATENGILAISTQDRNYFGE